MRFRLYYVYIMASYSRVLYTGVTNDLRRRVEQHRACVDRDAFCARYRVFDLVYFEEYQTARQAIDRETQMKAYRRAKKVALIDRFNPQWVDLAPTAQIPRRLRGSE
ncbi:MAG TPA: GIY-YIG nuclease family protein [Thermoanaerobaculia bacterium]|nr:GIY-YIG nuclease family protein [Thermoanaerobaculia bacterium]